MIKLINDKIEAINELLTWLQKNKPELYEQRFVQLVQERCTLRRDKEAKMENPAIAAYGESQKGKSYLMGNLLQKGGEPFKISLPTGEKIDFVRSINPIGKMREATGVVTRFTAFNGMNAARYSSEYPVLVKLLSVSDMATVLCDSYYNDLRGDHMHFSDEDIRRRADDIYNKYKDQPLRTGQLPLVEDDILNIKNYIQRFLVSKAYSLVNGANSSIFDKVALIIRRVPEQEWVDVLKFLWHDNSVFTQLFSRLQGAMSKLSYRREVYLPIDAVMHHGVNEKTIMSVACLNKLDQASFSETSDVYIRSENGQYTTVAGFNKAELCAICAEAAYRVDQDYLSSKVSYCLDRLPEETQGKMKTTVIEKDLINVADLLDFPGARNRESIPEEKLSDYDEKEGCSNTMKALLRGKVAYLFNKYCSSRAINILMFCHDQMNYNVTDMPFVIERWVKDYVGASMEERRKTLSMSEGISPLFVIATKFNMDMTLDQDNINLDSNSEAAVDNRWNGRFQEVLYRDCLQAHSVDWFRNWVREGETFKNTYLLRDYKYSNCTSDGSGLYEGYSETDKEPSEKTLHLPEMFYKRLRDTFVGNSIVQKFFEDPAKSWDLAATINNDGALYIIERLRTVARAMDTIRDNQFQNEIQECMKRVYKLMENDYEPEDDGKNLLKDIKTAKGIMREMDLSCQMDMYFFGHLIQTLQISPTLVYNEVKDFVDNGDTGNPDEKVYEIVLERCNYFEGCNSPGEMMKCYMQAYGWDTEEEAREDMRNRGLEESILFSQKKVRLSNSAMATRRVYSKWLKQMRDTTLFGHLLKDGRHHDVASLSALTTRMVDNAERLSLSDHLADAVAKYLDVVAIHTTNISMVSDIITHIINSFVCDWGYSMLSGKQLDDARMAAQQHGLSIDQYIGKGIEPLPKEEDVSRLFTEMMRENKGVTRTFRQNYNEWIEFMFVAFLGNAKHVIKDPVANHELGLILQKVK